MAKKIKSANVAIFIPNNGCSNNCSFCNQHSIVGQSYQPSTEDVVSSIEIAKKSLKDESKNAEIAFFGGSFTAIDRKYMVRLLETAYRYVETGLFKGIRISTRPDCIDPEILDILTNFGVTAIELGAQSLDDEVLSANNRGHTKLDIIKSSQLIKEAKISLALQMMTGLYKSTEEKDLTTAAEIIKLKPDNVRIYPTVVLRGTFLEKLYNAGLYKPYNVEKSVEICAKLINMLSKAKIDILRVGLHSSVNLEKEAIAGAYHPNFRELCENKIVLDNILEQINKKQLKGIIKIKANSKDLTKVIGYKRKNIEILKSLGYNIVIEQDNFLTDIKILPAD